MAAMHLADQGAEVVTIGRADETDRLVPGYLAWDRNKTRLHLDVDDATDRAELDRLLAYADVVVVDGADRRARACRAGRARTHDGPSATRAHVGAALRHPGRMARRAARARPAHGPDRCRTQPAVVPGRPRAPGVAAGLLRGGELPRHRRRRRLLDRVRSGQGQGVVVTGLDGVAQATATTRFGVPLLNIMGAPLGGVPNYRLYECADGEWLFLGALFEALYLQTLEVTDVLADVLADPAVDGDLRAALVPPGSATTMRLLEAAFRSLRVRTGSNGCSRRHPERRGRDTRGVVRQRDHQVEPDARGARTPGPRHRVHARRLVADERHARTRFPVAGAHHDDAGVGARSRVNTAPTATAAGDAPLAGVRVLDLGVVIAGTYAGSILAGLGADVVKIETPSGDPFRSYGPTFSVVQPREAFAGAGPEAGRGPGPVL